METQNQSGDEEILSVDFGRYLHAIRKYWWLVAALVAASVTAAVLYTNQQTPIYEATASVKIDPKIADVLGQGQDLVQLGAGGGASSAEYYKAERYILHSYQLLRRTVEDNDLHLELLSEAEREDLTQEAALDIATQRLGDAVTIRYPEQNRIFLITARSPDARLAARIANAHVDTYVAYSKGQLSSGIQKVSKDLSSELDLAQKELVEAEENVMAFQSDKKAVAQTLENQKGLVSANITLFSEKLNEVRADRIQKAALLARLEKLSAEDVLESPILGLSGNPSIDSLKTEYYLQRNKFLEVEKEHLWKTSTYKAQKAKVDDLYQALQQEARLVVRAVREQVAAAQAAEAALTREVERYTAESRALGPAIVDFNKLLRKKKSIEDKYNIVVARLGTSDIISRIDTINVTPQDAARVPRDAVYPVMQKNVALAGGAALFLGIALTFLIAFLDRSIKTAEDVQATAGVPVLGIIPILADSELPADDNKARDLYVFQHPTSRVAECCRSLRTNILFSAADKPLKTIVVSSPNPREGKTTSVIYLGTTMAQSGQRVLLIDSDMRRPRLHQSTGVSRQRGLSNLILGDATYQDVIKTTDIPNLYILPCGPLPPNPAELLMTKRFEVVLAELAERFNRIILDSPPLQAVTDAVVLSKQVDGVILVVKAGSTLRDEVKRSVKLLGDVGGVITGVILNELDIDDRRYGYYDQYYSYSSTESAPATGAEPA